MTATQPAACPIAHDYDPFDHEGFEFWRKARRETPVFFHEGLNAYVITRYADVARVLGDRGEHVSAAPALRPNIVPTPEAGKIMHDSGLVLVPTVVDEDGDEHKKHRRAAQPPFTVNRVRALEDFVRHQVVDQIEAIVDDGRADESTRSSTTPPAA